MIPLELVSIERVKCHEPFIMYQLLCQFKTHNLLLEKVGYNGIIGTIDLNEYLINLLLNHVDIQQLNLIMEILGTPPDDFMAKISSESVSECIRDVNNTSNYFKIVIINA